MSEHTPITGELRETIRSLAIDDSVLTIGGDDFHRICDAIDAVHAGLECENAELRERLAALDNRSESMHDGGRITDELREYAEAYEGNATHASLDLIADRIDAVHAQLEHDYKVACEVNERQDELYADMVHKLDRAYEKNRNQRRQLTEVQEALHRRNEGELKRRWMREKQDLELQIAKMRLESVELPKDADGEVWRTGDELLDDGMVCEVVGIGPNRLYYYVDATDTVEWTQADSRRHHHAPTVEDVLREMHAELDEVTALYVGEAIDSDERDRDEARIFAEYAKRLTLAGDAE